MYHYISFYRGVFEPKRDKRFLDDRSWNALPAAALDPLSKTAAIALKNSSYRVYHVLKSVLDATAL